MLGSYSPGAASGYWTFPQASVAAFAPELANNWEAIKREGASLAIREAFRRPGYHLVRTFSAMVNCQLRSDANGLQWSVGSDQVLPAAPFARAQAWLPDATFDVECGTAALLVAFFAASLWAVRRRSWPLMAIGCSILLKLAIHGVITAQPRYFLVVTAFMLLSVGLVGELPGGRPSWKEAGACIVFGSACFAVLLWTSRRAEAYVLAHEEQLVYRFTLIEPVGHSALHCVVGEGLLSLLTRGQASVRPLHLDPRPGERVVADCRVQSPFSTSLEFEFEDPYPGGGLPGRILQSVSVDGVEVVRHDMAEEPGASWIRVPLGKLAPGEQRHISLTVAAVAPDPGWNWGLAANTAFRLVSIPVDRTTARP
jgi:hypothetical protein